MGKGQQDRRSKRRFVIERELRFKLLERGKIVASGTGHTIDMGSRGVAFEVDQPLKAGALVELSISWPALLDQSCLMRLIVFGHVLRGGLRCAVSIDRYEFRTQGRVYSLRSSARPDPILRRWADTLSKQLKPATASA